MREVAQKHSSRQAGGHKGRCIERQAPAVVAAVDGGRKLTRQDLQLIFVRNNGTTQLLLPLRVAALCMHVCALVACQ